MAITISSPLCSPAIETLREIFDLVAGTRANLSRASGMPGEPTGVNRRGLHTGVHEIHLGSEYIIGPARLSTRMLSG